MMRTKSNIRVSLVINTKNEEQNIAACIVSAGKLPDEIIVCDMYSTDRTREIAESLAARVVLHKPEPIVEKARRFAIEQAKGEWIMLLDADEQATPALLDELRTFLQRDDVNVVWVRWRFLFMGKFLSHTSMSIVRKPVLFRRKSYLDKAPSDEECGLHKGSWRTLRELPGQIIARERFMHYAYPTLDKYVSKTLQYYSAHDALGRFSDGQRPSWLKLILWPLRVFFGSYVLQKGFLDGIEGFIFSVVFAIHRFLIIAHMYDLQAGRVGDLGISDWRCGPDSSFLQRNDLSNGREHKE
jgi:glycosyltransferase involved in cell wall biosynthesis